MPIHLRFSLCMLIAREKKERTRERERERKNRQMYLQLPAATVVSLRFHCGKRWPRRCRPLATSRMTIRVKSIPSVCHHGGCHPSRYRTLCAPCSAQAPPAIPNSRNDATRRRFFRNYEMHLDIDAPPPSNVQSNVNYNCYVNPLTRSKRYKTKKIFLDINLIRLC